LGDHQKIKEKPRMLTKEIKDKLKETTKRLKELKKKFNPKYYYMGYCLNNREVKWLIETVEDLKVKLKEITEESTI
jgi:hypothetical protein